MAITKDSGRQTPVVARVSTAAADISAQATYAAIDVPAGAIVIGGYAKITAAFDSSVTLDIGDDGDVDRYIANGASGTYPAVDALEEQTLGNVVMLAPTGYQYTAPNTIDIKLAGAANTTGTIELVVVYIVVGREEFSEG